MHVTPSYINRWQTDGISLEYSDWKEIFIKTKTITKNIRHCMINYKIMHKNYAADNIVAKFDSSVSPDCIICKVKRDLIHTFVDCSNVQLLWSLLEKCLMNNLIKCNQWRLCKRMKLVGVLKRDQIECLYVIDFILLKCRIFIHTSVVNKTDVSFIIFLRFLKKEIYFEKKILIKECYKYRQLNMLDDLV